MAYKGYEVISTIRSQNRWAGSGIVKKHLLKTERFTMCGRDTKTGGYWTKEFEFFVPDEVVSCKTCAKRAEKAGK